MEKQRLCDLIDIENSGLNLEKSVGSRFLAQTTDLSRLDGL